MPVKNLPLKIGTSVFLALTLFALLTSCQLEITSLSASNYTIGASTQYTFAIFRYSLTPLELSSSLTLTFDNAYALLITNPICSSPNFGNSSLECTYLGTKLTINNLFSSNLYNNIQSFTFRVAGIRNPSPAKDYTPVSQFVISSLSGATLQSGNNLKTLTIVPLEAVCSAEILNGLVFARGQLSISYNSAYILGNSNSSYYLNVRMNSYYPADSTQTLVSPLISPSVVATQPIGSQYIYSLQYVTSIVITMLMPPSTQSQDTFITLFSFDKKNDGTIDSCSITLEGVQPNNFTQTIISSGTVQTTTNLQFNLQLSTPLMNTDSLRILFPSSFSLGAYESGSLVSVAGYGSFPVSKLGNLLIVTVSLGSTVLNANLIFTLNGIGMPFTTSPAAVQLSLLTFDSYYRINQTFTYIASPGLLDISLNCLSYQIGSTTTCSFLITTASALTSDATLVISLPSSFPVVQGSSTCSLSGSGLVSSTTCLYSSTLSTIQAIGMNRTSSNLSPLTFTFSVSLTMSQLIGNFTLQASTKSSGNIVDTGTVFVSATSRQLSGSQFLLVSSSSTTSSPTTYTLTFNLPFDMGYTYTISLYLPVFLQSGMSPSVINAILVSYNNLTLTFSAAGMVNRTITVGNLLTPASQQPITAKVNISNEFHQMFQGTQQLIMTNMRAINTFTISQNNSIVYALFTAIVVVSDLSIGDRIHLTSSAGSYFYPNSPNCTTEIACTSGAVLIVSSIDNAGKGLTSFELNLVNLAYIGAYTITATIYDSLGIYGKQTGSYSLSTTTPNIIIYSSNQSNPYLGETDTYTFTLNFTTPNATFLTAIPSGFTVISAQCILNCGTPSFMSGYLFPITSVYAVISLTTTNPHEFTSLTKFTFTTSNAQGTKDSSQFIPQLICSLPCRSCDASNTSRFLSCYSWMSEKYLSDGTCLGACLVGTYPSSTSQVCIKCPSNCTSCVSEDNCLSCQGSLYLSSGNCLVSCPENSLTMVNVLRCEPCMSPCFSCSIVTSNCTGCISSFYFLNNSCLSQCPGGYFQSVLGNKCLKCNSSCLTCYASQCLSCLLPKYLYRGQCYSTCPMGSYPNGNLCQPCPNSCKICSSNTSCSSCLQGYFLNPNATCNTFCQDGYFPNLLANTCNLCDLSCALCNSTGCLSCSNPNLYLQNQSCVPTCSSPLYPNNQTMICQACVAPCLACSIWSDICASCIGGYSLLNAACLSVCPIGYYSDGSRCQTCSTLCYTCSFVNLQQSCSSCLNNSYIFSYDCVQTCPNDTQVSGQYCISRNCPSLDNCLVCSGFRCLQCGSLYTLNPSTYSCTKQATTNEVLAALSEIPVPFPFLIAILMLIVMSFFLKHAFPKMFSPLFIYSLAGTLQQFCLVMWTALALLWNANIPFPSPFPSVVYATVLILIVYSVLNVVQFIFWQYKIASDRQYKLWEKQDNRFASLFIAILGIVLSFRLDALKFSRTGNSPRLSARLSSPDLFGHYSILAMLGIVVNVCSIVVAVYVFSIQSEANYLFFSCLQVAIVSVLMTIISSILLCVPKEQLIEDKGQYKYGHDEDHLQGPSLQQALAVEEEHHSNGEVCSESGSAVMRKQSHYQQASQDITLEAPDKLTFEDGQEGFQFAEQTGQQRCAVARKQSNEDIFASVCDQPESENHILIDEIEENKITAISMAHQYFASEILTTPLFNRQAGTIAKQKLLELPDELQDQESNFGEFEEYSLDYKTKDWKKAQRKEEKQVNDILADQSPAAEGIIQARMTIQRQIATQQRARQKKIQMQFDNQRQRLEQLALQHKLQTEQARRREKEEKQSQFKKKIENISKLNQMLSLMSQQQHELQHLTSQLAQEQEDLKQQEDQYLREKKQRMLMSIEDNLSSMANILQAVQFTTNSYGLFRKKKKLPQQNDFIFKPQNYSPLKYNINEQENLPKELSPTKIKISPRPHPSQYKRQHIFVEEGICILSEDQKTQENQLDHQMEIVFEQRSKEIIAESKNVEKPKSIVRKQTAKKRPQKQLHQIRNKKSQLIKDSHTSKASEKGSKRLQINRPVLIQQMQQALAPIHYYRYQQEYKGQSQLVEAAVLPRVSPQASQHQIGETNNIELPEGSELFQVPLPIEEQDLNPIQIQDTDNEMSSSRQTHWPAQPELKQRILQADRRANTYINKQQNREASTINYIVQVPSGQIYQEQQDQKTEEDDWEGNTVKEIVFGQEDKMVQVQELMRSDTKKRFRVGRANRRVIDLSPN